ncbi:MAG: hypothetical protein ACLFUJ_00820 [Phycisphaerae bacterium]
MEAKSDKDRQKEIDSLKSDIQDLRKDVKSLMSTLKDDGSDKLNDLKERLAATYSEKKEAAGRSLRSAHDRVRSKADSLHKTAEEHPFTTAIVALCSGLIAGAMLGHRK